MSSLGRNSSTSPTVVTMMTHFTKLGTASKYCKNGRLTVIPIPKFALPRHGITTTCDLGAARQQGSKAARRIALKGYLEGEAA